MHALQVLPPLAALLPTTAARAGPAAATGVLRSGTGAPDERPRVGAGSASCQALYDLTFPLAVPFRA